LVNLTALPTGPGSYVAATLAPGERATDPLHCTRIDPKPFGNLAHAISASRSRPTVGWCGFFSTATCQMGLGIFRSMY